MINVLKRLEKLNLKKTTINYFLTLHPIKLHFLFLISIIIVDLAFSSIYDQIFGPEELPDFLVGSPDVSLFLSALLLAPIFETLIFQHAYFLLIRRLKIKWNIIVIFVSAAIFGLMHYYSIGYIVFATSIGFVLMVAYLVFAYRGENAFWSVTLLHAARNSMSLIIMFLFPQY